MHNTENVNCPKHRNKRKFRLTIIGLFFLGIIAITFSVLIMQVQSGTSAYLAGLTLWSRGQSEAIKHTNIYLRSSDTTALSLARKSYQWPLGDMIARKILERENFQYQAARAGFLQGGNHPDDVARMIWLFHFFQDAPYFRDAVDVWRRSDEGLTNLGKILDRLESYPRPKLSQQEVVALDLELDLINQQLDHLQTEFRLKMSLASRDMTTILSITTIILFLVLGGIASFFLNKLTATTRRSERKFRNTFENAAVGIAQLDVKGKILDANSALCHILNYAYSDLINGQIQLHIHNADYDVFSDKQLTLVQNDQKKVTFKQRLRRHDNSIVWAQITMSQLTLSELDNTEYICIFEDVTEQHRLTTELNYHAKHDNLTGLINRRTFDQHLDDTLANARANNTVHNLGFIDLDQFKIINDTLGHAAGDKLLLQVTQLFSNQLRASDTIARLGGDEFGLIIGSCAPEKAEAIANNLRCSLNDHPFVWNDRSFNITCSIGIVPITAENNSEIELLQAADSACQMAKEQGRNRVILTTHDNKDLAARRIQMEWVERIRHAIDQDRLFLDAQKLVPLAPNQPNRIEVLVRMLGDEGEVIPPNAFIPAAERFGLAHLLDRWVIENVCLNLQQHPSSALQFDAYHINISGKSFDQPDFVDYTINVINRYKVEAKSLCFEITETAAISNLSLVQQFIEQLGELGSTFALDDFGAGLSSFSYLKQLPVEYLKIDGGFVKNMANDETDRAMVKAISDIGRTLGKVIIAEFVEDQSSLDYLRDMGVEFGQGYHLHRPENFREILLKASAND